MGSSHSKPSRLNSSSNYLAGKYTPRAQPHLKPLPTYDYKTRPLPPLPQDAYKPLPPLPPDTYTQSSGSEEKSKTQIPLLHVTVPPTRPERPPPELQPAPIGRLHKEAAPPPRRKGSPAPFKQDFPHKRTRIDPTVYNCWLSATTFGHATNIDDGILRLQNATNCCICRKSISASSDNIVLHNIQNCQAAYHAHCAKKHLGKFFDRFGRMCRPQCFRCQGAMNVRPVQTSRTNPMGFEPFESAPLAEGRSVQQLRRNVAARHEIETTLYQAGFL